MPLSTTTANDCWADSPSGSAAVTITVVVPSPTGDTVTTLPSTLAAATVVSPETASKASASPSGSEKAPATSTLAGVPPATRVTPEIESATSGARLASTATEAVPTSSRNVALTVPVPLPKAVATPVALIENTSGASLDHCTVASNAAPFWSVTDAVNVSVSPNTVNSTDAGETEIAVGRGGSGGVTVPPSPPPQPEAARQASPSAPSRTRFRGPPPAVHIVFGIFVMTVP